MIFNVIIDFFTGASVWELLFIFFAKIIEVSIGTMRMILTTKGFRKPATLLSFFEIMLWVFVASVVIADVTEIPIKGVVYGLGFAAGVYVGSILENYFAVGKMEVHVISKPQSADKIVKVLRENGYGATAVDAHGKDDQRTLLIIYTNRKNKDTIIKLITEEDEKALIVAQEVSLIQNGYVIPWRRIRK